MCKVFAMTNMSKVKVSNKFLNIVNAMVTKSDNDGFGYALLSKNGDIGGERTLKPASFLPLENISSKMTYRLPFVEKTKNSFGFIDLKKPKAFIGHGRWSTNSVSLDNTHPFVTESAALIHNGVVQNATKEELNLSTDCDTEILMKYWEKGKIEEIEKKVSGYYAMAILEKNGYLHIVRDGLAELHFTYSKTIDSYIFATTPEIIQGVAKHMKWAIEEIESLKENIHIIFDGNKIISQNTITPLGRAWASELSWTERQALGHNNRSLINEEDYELGTQWNKNYYGHGARTYDPNRVPKHKENSKEYYKDRYSRESKYKDDYDKDEYTEDDHVRSFLENEETQDILNEIMDRHSSKKKIG